MTRFLVALAISLFLVAEAAAQTSPAASTKAKAKSTKATVRVNRREVQKARRVAMKAPTPVVNDGWPAIDEPQVAVASAAAVPAPVVAEALVASRGEIDNANVYAAPGMPIHVRTARGVVPYSIRPARKPAGGKTTLSNGN